MTRERLERLSFPTLREIAEKEGISIKNSVGRSDLIDLILEAMEEDRDEREHLNNLAIRVEEKKYDITIDEELESEEKQEYPISERYNETRLTLLLRDPLWAFAYWDIKDLDYKKIQNTMPGFSLILRVHESRDSIIGDDKYIDSFDIPVTLTDNRWYINLPRAGSTYYAELLSNTRKKENSLATSNLIISSRNSIEGTLEKTMIMDSKNDILVLSGLYDVGENLQNEKIPQRIISLLDARNFSLK